ncbi:hypothetical protein QWJ34_25745 [Saccharibacillus sp. CPCC 101409]|uniref:hypothetical protein n=1 Tax=Saccharibacillus sp. CPCC 101409 TaxID=3058041 RepID=UPI0026732FC3|nr:hypothetical protein [Saccharibacillus sp. CPCC 101409]MDO3413181.1 hypothetical protein [Saccharibacillus sp. CPCC 101409]
METNEYILGGGELTITIKAPEVCTGTRFDRTGWITQVRLESAGIDFCVPESLEAGQGTGGEGLSGEFGIDRPIGYDEAAPGETFTKLGVGVLTRIDDEAYSFARAYPVEAHEVRTEVGRSMIRFTAAAAETSGYAAELVKTIRVEGRSLSVHYKLTNRGSRNIATNEYVHNFVGIGGHMIDSNYVLRLPYRPELALLGDGGVEDRLELSDGKVTWKREAGGEFYALFGGFAGDAEPYWELLHEPSGYGMRESGDFDVPKLAVWGNAHVVAPEVFIDLALTPGETKEWTRTYEFFGPEG